MPRLSKIGAAALAAFGWTAGASVTASYLVVAGGSGGGVGSGGGGGAGGYRTGTTSLNPTLSYTVTVGAGGASGTTSSGGGNGDGGSGSDSIFSSITATAGGYGAGGQLSPRNGGNGGSGGGGSDTPSSGGTGNTPSTSPSQGSNGGAGSSGNGGGGGGAGAVGTNASGGAGGNGGAGTASSISGSSVTYAGGGGGAGSSSGGTGGSGGGGAGGTGTGAAGNGTANLGGGGGGTRGSTASGAGGSGIVIISYTGVQQFGGGVVTSVGGNTIHTFTTSGTLSPLSSLTASYLIVAGGGGGGSDVGGGGGAGGLLSGSSLTLDTNSIYAVTVGAGGAASTTTANGVSGSSSSFSMVSTTAVGGGGGASASNTAGSSGGSGGGGTRTSGAGGTGTSGQGNNGGSGSSSTGANVSAAGGGGGASAVGSNATGGVGGNGGAGTSSSISGTSTTYAGGGGGRCDGSGTQGTGGSGGGGNAGTTGVAGTANLGGGGGGGSSSGGNGGSGIVIISYPGSTPQMAGGTVTVAGGNVIHTFTSSGYLSPIVTLNKSLRIRSSASAYLNRTPASAGNAQKFTMSCWVKIGSDPQSSAQITFLNAGNGSQTNSTNDEIQLRTNGTALQVGVLGKGGTGGTYAQFTPYYRDYASWYHVVVAIDTTQATQANRCRAYVNGVEVTNFVVNGFTLNYSFSYINSTSAHLIGRNNEGGGPVYTDAYFAEYNFIDGQQLTPNSFGSFNGLGVWQPVRYGGSYGTNGFYLPFTNTTSTTTLGYDFSPNGNNWTTNNISLTAGSTYDSMTDVPTNTSATVANYAVMNPLVTGSCTTLSNGNLNTLGNTSSNNGNSRSSFAMLTGKWYFETTLTAANVGIYPQLGIMTTADGNRPNNGYPQAGYSTSSVNPTQSVIYMADGQKQTNGSASSYGSSFTNGDVIGIAIDSDNGAIYFGKQTGGTGSMVWQNSGVPTSGSSKTGAALTWTGGTVEHLFSIADYNGTATATNFGQRPFSATPPTGFVALNTYNLSTPTIGATPATTANNYFNAVLYSGNSSTQNIAVGFQPDFVWSKCRNVARSHRLSDAVRGSTRDLYSDTTSAEQNDGSITSFISTGFSLNNATGSAYNTSGETYVSWAWKANGSGSTNTAGSIISTVSSNTTAGFSIVAYNGTGIANDTVGHGLGVAPSMIIFKNRQSVFDWPVYHSAVGASNVLFLNTTAAQTSSSIYINGVAPTSTVFTLGTSGSTNSGANQIAYCFAQVAGYSAFGSYTGNGSSDGPFIFTGFRPRYVLIKSTVEASNWLQYDTARMTYNKMDTLLYPSLSNAENTDSTYAIDVVSNGFKIRGTGQYGGYNNNGNAYIYMAFAESPFKYANAR